MYPYFDIENYITTPHCKHKEKSIFLEKQRCASKTQNQKTLKPKNSEMLTQTDKQKGNIFFKERHVCIFVSVLQPPSLKYNVTCTFYFN